MKIKILFLSISLFVILLPWFNSSSEKYLFIPEISQESNDFYEINPCKISLYEFIKANPKSIYQDHYYFRPLNKSSISCFGKISGISVQQLGIETQFFISIGTNSFLNLILQSTFWILIMCYIPRNKFKNFLNINFYINEILIFLTSLLLSYSIYSQPRYYDSNFYFFDFSDKKSYILLFLIFWLITKNLVIVFYNRLENVLNFFPIFFIFTFIFSGFNLNLLSILLIFLGLKNILLSNNLRSFNKAYLFLSLWWLFNSHGSYYFKVGKLRSFTSSSYDFNSNLYWIIFFILVINGIYELYRESSKYFNYSLFTKNVSVTTFLILTSGLIGANFPFLSFFQYYYFGLQRYVVNITNPFIFDEYGVKVSWRGIFPSSETVGEIYGVSLLLILFCIVQSKKLRRIDVVGVIASGFGLYFSDNKTAIVLVFLFTFSYLIFDNLKLSRKIRSLTFFGFALIVIFVIYITVGSDYLFSTYDFMSTSLSSKIEISRFDSINSSFALLIKESEGRLSFFNFVFGIVSATSLLLNRSEMWGVFFARFNPSFMELLFGSGPLSFGQLYGEILIADQNTFLLPHSSVLSNLVFFGVVPLIFFLFKYIKEIFTNLKNKEYLYLLFFIIFNLIKNDSFNYFSLFTFYYLIILLFKFKKNKATTVLRKISL